jgi:hypothetical protein
MANRKIDIRHFLLVPRQLCDVGLETGHRPVATRTFVFLVLVLLLLIESCLKPRTLLQRRRLGCNEST